MTTAIVLPTTPDTVLRRDEGRSFGALPPSAAPCRLHPGVYPVLMAAHGRAEPADPLVHGTMATVWFGDEQ